MNSTRNLLIALLVAVLVQAPGLATATAGETTNTVSAEALEVAVQAHVDRQEAQRARVADLLQRDEIRAIAATAGLDLARAEAAVATLSGDELREAALAAERAERALAGGDAVVITRFGLIVILLVVIILLLI